MKRLLIVLVVVFGFVGAGFAGIMDDFFGSDISNSFVTVTSNLAHAMANNFQFYTGAGNMTPVNTSKFLGLKLGVGVGLMFNSTFMDFAKLAASGATEKEFMNELMFGNISTTDPNADIFAEIARTIALLPLPYDMAYCKVGLPEVLPRPFKTMDVGVRLGILPPISLSEGTTSFNLSGFHFGVEARSLLLGKSKSKFKVELRASWDWDFGNIDMALHTNMQITAATNVGGIAVPSSDAGYELGMGLMWGGSSIGVKIAAGFDSRLFRIYCGLGMNFIVGQFTSSMYMKGDVTFGTETLDSVNINAESSCMYMPFDMSVFVGFQILIFNFAGEYSLVSGAAAINIYPLVLKF